MCVTLYYTEGTLCYGLALFLEENYALSTEHHTLSLAISLDIILRILTVPLDRVHNIFSPTSLMRLFGLQLWRTWSEAYIL